LGNVEAKSFVREERTADAVRYTSDRQLFASAGYPRKRQLYIHHRRYLAVALSTFLLLAFVPTRRHPNFVGNIVGLLLVFFGMLVSVGLAAGKRWQRDRQVFPNRSASRLVVFGRNLYLVSRWIVSDKTLMGI
jgi:Flp pilus assembly protein TadB